MKKKIIFTIILFLLICLGDYNNHSESRPESNTISSIESYNFCMPLFGRFLQAQAIQPKEKPEKQSTKEELNKAYNNYAELKKLYIKWNKGLLKSRRYYKKFITKYLIDTIGKELLTDYDYLVISPEGVDGKELTCNLYLGRWLQIKGDIKQESLIKIVEKNPSLLTKWWRSRNLLSVQGKLKDFKLDSDAFGEVVILYLKDIKVREVGGDIAGKNSK